MGEHDSTHPSGRVDNAAPPREEHDSTHPSGRVDTVGAPREGRGPGEQPARQPIGVPELTRPGDALRSLPAEARERGTRLVSARAMQARLFSVYDAAAAAEDALALVQEQLTLTLNRSYYEEDEIELTAARLDALLMTRVVQTGDTDPEVAE